MYEQIVCAEERLVRDYQAPCLGWLLILQILNKCKNWENCCLFQIPSQQSLTMFNFAFSFLIFQCRLLQNNNISGHIPKELGYLPNLQTLDLSNNKLFGHIPESFGFLNHLQYLWVCILDFIFFLKMYCSFVTSFCLTIFVLSVIVICLVVNRRLNNNSLSGAVPLSLASLPQLTFLWVLISLCVCVCLNI